MDRKTEAPKMDRKTETQKMDRKTEAQNWRRKTEVLWRSAKRKHNGGPPNMSTKAEA